MEAQKLKQPLGFTLIELMLVLAILALLLAIAYPLYNSQSQRVRRAEAITALSIIAYEEERFYTVNGAYTGLLTDLAVSTKWQTEHRTENGYYTLDVTTSNAGQGFLAQAVAHGNQSGDEDCHVFSINHLGIKSATAAVGSTGDPSTCW